MSKESFSIILRGVGSYNPPKILTNDDLSRMVDTTDEWIRTRTGIRERRIAENQATSDMAVKAAEEAIQNAGIEKDEIDLIICATITPDNPFPATACNVQTKLGLSKIPAFDIGAACSGFLYGLEVGQSMMRSGKYRHTLVIGAEKLSSITDWEDRTTCVLFGDGAGAAILSRDETPGRGILGSLLGCDGAEREILFMPGGGSAMPVSEESVRDKQHHLRMHGRQVFKIAVRVMAQSAQDIVAQHGLSSSDIACVVPHQANMRIIEALSSTLDIPIDRFKINLDRFGNTSAASIPIALDEAVRNYRIKSGDLVLLVAFGAGLTWGSTLLRWQ